MRPTRQEIKSVARRRRNPNGASRAIITADDVRQLAEKPVLELMGLFRRCSGTNESGLETLFGVKNAALDREALELLEPMFFRYFEPFCFKTERFNSWEFNIPTSELHGLVYLADYDNEFVIMSQYEIRNTGDVIDVEIIGIDNDFSTVTVSTGTNFSWGQTVCYSYDSLREAYFAAVIERRWEN